MAAMYDYLIVGGETYYPTNIEGNSEFHIPIEPDKDMDCRLPLLDKKYEHITKYDKEGYVRTIIDGNTIVFLCFTPDDDGKLVLIAETDDEVSRDSFIEALEKVVLSDAPKAPTGEPVRKVHFLHRAIIITPIFIVVLIVTLVILSGIKPKKKEETEETIKINE